MYRTDFLNGGVDAPLPTFSAALDGDILRRPGLLDDDIYAHYPHFTVVMNQRRRSPAFVALNIHQGRLGGRGSKSWAIDTRVGSQNQLNNDYYIHNVWDRGHMARRASAAWGNTQPEKDRASRETYYWTNAALQHQWLNQDEWLGLEDWARTLQDDENNRVSVISGPIYSNVNLYLEPSGRPPAAIPSAFFKVVLFRHRDTPNALAVRAFIMPQNAATMRRNGEWRMQDLQNYQVSIRLIERETGLVFDDSVAAANPLFFDESNDATELGVTEFPEVNEIDVPEDIIDPDQPRDPVLDSHVVILAAMVNPIGDERAGEWVSVANLTNASVNLDGWILRDYKKRDCRLSGMLEPGEARRIQPVAGMMLSNTRRGFILLLDSNGNRIDRAAYRRREARQEGHPIVFVDPRRFERPLPEDNEG